MFTNWNRRVRNLAIFFLIYLKTFRLSDDVNLDIEFDECERKPHQFFPPQFHGHPPAQLLHFLQVVFRPFFFNPIYYQMNIYLLKKKLFLK